MVRLRLYRAASITKTWAGAERASKHRNNLADQPTIDELQPVELAPLRRHPIALDRSSSCPGTLCSRRHLIGWRI
jgi:hypothetical protein